MLSSQQRVTNVWDIFPLGLRVTTKRRDVERKQYNICYSMVLYFRKNNLKFVRHHMTFNIKILGYYILLIYKRTCWYVGGGVSSDQMDYYPNSCIRDYVSTWLC